MGGMTLVPVDHEPDFDTHSLVPVDYNPFAAEQFANPAVEGAITGLATLPQRAIQNSQYSLDTGNYDPGPTLEAATLPMGTGAIAGVPLNAGEAALGAGIRTYRNVPDTLMGYRKSGPQKGFEETNYPHTQDIEVTLPGSSGPETFRDAVKGMNPDHAVERAYRNWPDALHITPVAPQSVAAPAGIRAYHGSPHDFDAFSMDKIGTGEGAQAYGHGLYFAENEGVAKSYRDTLAKNNQRPAVASTNGPFGNVPILEQDPMRPGKMYEVNINADPEHFLDWDKPLSEQPQHVRDAFMKAMPDTSVTQAWKTNGVLDNAPLASLYKGIAGQTNADVAAGKVAQFSNDLHQAGIPGIKYLDQGSRGLNVQMLSPKETVHGDWLVKHIPNGQVLYRGPDEAAARAAYDAAPKPSQNFVVFNHDLINIVRKYAAAGIALPPAIAAEYARQFQPVDHNPFAAQGQM